MVDKIGNEKNTSLQVLRALAFLGVFTSHLGLTHFGGIGVEIFLILSGYLLVIRNINRDTLREKSLFANAKYAYDKIKPLFELHFITMIVAMPILILNNYKLENPIIRIITKFILNLGLMQSWVPIEEFRYSMNNLSWYLSVSVFLYFSFPYILSFLRSVSSIRIILIASVTVILVQIAVGIGIEYLIKDETIVQGLTYNSPLYRLGDFIIGCNLGYLAYKKDSIPCFSKRVVWTVTILLLIVTESIVYYVWNIECFTWCKNTVVLIPASCMLVWMFSDIKPINLKIWHTLIKLGDISAFTYLIHELTIRYFNLFLLRVLHLDNSLTLKFVVGVVTFFITIIFAILYQHFVKVKYEIRTNKKYKA